ncbi:DNA helicase/exodeoxyribonuclease V gamma subunit [Allofrancisella inopinata]|uniref:RecBCD enzyme subunit RecC n=1 Tax=Allofrancisella inopinata TaxID=1085647 RepID=A0AAE6YK56_9GAMM|nr:exodeoxyribonuclease V subunit gamma [Allofrancisella inopinata]QIV96369.1 exodeoxyribonuclease V subunit gamma [Allofrancisella inopinata]TDT73349.1 DNA helicase/exodeoxyribonuclease V gamma subunit [Allofrancisella inopinata]
MALYTYPSNKLEYLVKIFSKLLQINKNKIFKPTYILVGSRGMQHWLSMELAKQNSISMNTKFDMVNSFIINTSYEITNNQSHKKAYSKEVLSWRIFKLLDDIGVDKLKNYYKDSSQRKYQLSAQIANVFSKYIKYRPAWLEKWQNLQFISTSPSEDELWQAKLWQLLISENPKTPIQIQKQGIGKLSSETLPKDIYIFGVSAISPNNLEFLLEVAKYTNIHLLYLNPCSEYWYDLKKAKVASWLNTEEDFTIQPLLASFGQQGKDFFNQLLEQNQQEFTSFEHVCEDIKITPSEASSLLTNIQRNILELNTEKYTNSIDNSIIINSCHSPLREIQVLHDNLLELFEQDSTLQPQDVLVMCPNIEDYAPYIESVFTKSPSDSPNKLPCSIADRTIIDSESLAASFIEILKLPDSNFEVTKIIDYLSVPALQRKFDITLDQLETIKYWLTEACIYRGLNNQTFSWNWGLKRLLLGFCLADEPMIIEDSLQTLPNIQTNDIQELGKLYELIELLQSFSEELKQKRSAHDWQEFLLKILDTLFNIDDADEYIANIIKQNIAKIVQHTHQANFTGLIDLAIIRNILTTALSEPIINNHFLRGKITFCSMTPMRSIPFKVIAMLGLNSTTYPRKDTKISFDLTNHFSAQKGDRTKRDDDKYLFLETIISARSVLYLSFQGNSYKNNSEQEPSLIIKEFISYLETHYNWELKYNLKKYPLHPFSPKCYSKNYQSYDDKWLKLIKAEKQNFNSQQNINIELPTKFSLQEIVNIFDDPFKAYSQYTLDLTLQENEPGLSDTEPFEIDALQTYKIKEHFLNCHENHKDIDLSVKHLRFSGRLPQSPLTDELLHQNLDLVSSFYDKIDHLNLQSLALEANIQNIKIYSNIKLSSDNTLTLYKVSSLKPKDKLQLYLKCILYNHIYNEKITGEYLYINDKKVESFKINTFKIENVEDELSHYLIQAINFLKQPTLAHISLLEPAFQENNNKINEVLYKGPRPLAKNLYYKLLNDNRFNTENLNKYYTKAFKDIILNNK